MVASHTPGWMRPVASLQWKLCSLGSVYSNSKENKQNKIANTNPHCSSHTSHICLLCRIWFRVSVIEYKALGSLSSSTIEKALTSLRLHFLICKMQIMYALPASKGCCERLIWHNTEKWLENYQASVSIRNSVVFMSP